MDTEHVLHVLFKYTKKTNSRQMHDLSAHTPKLHCIGLRDEYKGMDTPTPLDKTIALPNFHFNEHYIRHHNQVQHKHITTP